MKKLYEELELEIIRFGAADIITASDAADDTDTGTDTDDATDDATDDTSDNGGTSTSPTYYGLDGNPADPPAGGLTIVENFYVGDGTPEGSYQVYRDSDGNYWYEDGGNYYRWDYE